MDSITQTTVGIYAGSFDPPHRGHESVVRYVLQHRLVQHVYICGNNPNKSKPNRLPYPIRRRLLKYMFDDMPNVTIVDDMIDTWLDAYRANREQDGQKVTVYGIIGSDIFIHYSLNNKRPKLPLSHWIVIYRSGSGRKIPPTVLSTTTTASAAGSSSSLSMTSSAAAPSSSHLYASWTAASGYSKMVSLMDVANHIWAQDMVLFVKDCSSQTLSSTKIRQFLQACPQLYMESAPNFRSISERTQQHRDSLYKCMPALAADMILNEGHYADTFAVFLAILDRMWLSRSSSDPASGDESASTTWHVLHSPLSVTTAASITATPRSPMQEGISFDQYYSQMNAREYHADADDGSGGEKNGMECEYDSLKHADRWVVYNPSQTIAGRVGVVCKCWRRPVSFHHHKQHYYGKICNINDKTCHQPQRTVALTTTEALATEKENIVNHDGIKNDIISKKYIDNDDNNSSKLSTRSVQDDTRREGLATTRTIYQQGRYHEFPFSNTSTSHQVDDTSPSQQDSSRSRMNLINLDDDENTGIFSSFQTSPLKRWRRGMNALSWLNQQYTHCRSSSSGATQQMSNCAATVTKASTGSVSSLSRTTTTSSLLDVPSAPTACAGTSCILQAPSPFMAYHNEFLQLVVYPYIRGPTIGSWWRHVHQSSNIRSFCQTDDDTVSDDGTTNNNDDDDEEETITTPNAPENVDEKDCCEPERLVAAISWLGLGLRQLHQRTVPLLGCYGASTSMIGTRHSPSSSAYGAAPWRRLGPVVSPSTLSQSVPTAENSSTSSSNNRRPKHDSTVATAHSVAWSYWQKAQRMMRQICPDETKINQKELVQHSDFVRQPDGHVCWIHGDVNLDNFIIQQQQQQPSTPACTRSSVDETNNTTNEKTQTMLFENEHLVPNGEYSFVTIDLDKFDVGFSAYEYEQFLSVLRLYQQKWPLPTSVYEECVRAFKAAYGACMDGPHTHAFSRWYWEQLKPHQR